MYSDEFAKMWFKLYKDVKVYMDHQLAPSLTESQFTVLEYIQSHERTKPSDLIHYLSTTPAAVTTMLDRMEKNGLVERHRDNEDRRIVWVRLTDKGIEECARGKQLREEFLNNYLGEISVYNQHLLVYLLGKITHIEPQQQSS
ncbi:MAG: MarR family transcriptional regulator [Paenibacillaceae bacterium]|jgi:DNA-binding MarR family transcriptional regulator|nr:MarR family transcriptional regulator [Paenibacillaceae bacterium]